MKYETDEWPYVPAKFQGDRYNNPKVRVITIHAMQSQERVDTAENVGHFFKDVVDRPASAHIGVDSDSTVQYVKDSKMAYGAKGVNNDGIHVELAGKAEQSGAEWLDPYGVLMLDRAAKDCAQYALKYDIPIKKLSPTELKAGKKGFIGHVDATQVYKPNAGHTDPGPGFPWVFFLGRVKVHYDKRKAEKS